MRGWHAPGSPFSTALLPVVGLALADASAPSAKRVDWAGTGTLLWLALFTVLAGVGAVMLLQARRPSGHALTA